MTTVVARGQPWLRLVLMLSAVVGVVVGVWAAAELIGWDEDRVVDWIPSSPLLAGVIVVVLLVADAVLPIPATIVMLGAGAALGPIVGSLVSGVGLTMASGVGYSLGRALPDRSVDPLRLHPAFVAATRGLPIVSEAIAIGAGVTKHPFPRFISAAAVGSFAVGALYAIVGWAATDHWSLVVFAVALAGASYVAATRLLRIRGRAVGAAAVG